jgi:hypothetical protein
MDNKDVRYELNSNDQSIIRVKNNNIMQEYKNVKKQIKRDSYPKQYFPNLKKLPFGKKIMTRTFAKNKLRPNDDIMEVKSKTSTRAYTFVTIKWQISGPINETKVFNFNSLNSVRKIMPDLLDSIPLTQFHKTIVEKETTTIDLILKNPEYTKA